MSIEQKKVEQVGNFYEAEITSFWEMVHKRHMHVGYWDESIPDDNLEKGSKRLTSMLVDMVSIGRDKKFLDLGCGFGMPALELAEKKECYVTGLTVSSYQAEEANKMAKQRKLDSRVNFFVQDAMNMKFETEFFDGAWFFESIFHMDHEDVLKALHPLLKPNSEIIIADFNRLDTITADDRQFLQDVLFTNSLVSKEEYPALLKRCGYDLMNMEDITNETIITWEKYSRSTIDYRDDILKLGGMGLLEMMEQFWPKVEDVMKRSGGYLIIKAKRV